jgi:hypothetical protein
MKRDIYQYPIYIHNIIIKHHIEYGMEYLGQIIILYKKKQIKKFLQ